MNSQLFLYILKDINLYHREPTLMLQRLICDLKQMQQLILILLLFSSAYFGATFNSFIHVLMYSYYGLSAVPAMRPYLWWKKYITQGQLVQFVLTMFQTSCAVVWPCGFPMGWLYFQITYMITLILLFSNFYIKTYKSRMGSRKTDHSNGSINGHTNGVTSNEKVKYRKPRAD
ncbi:elongation of very long chain fatty acids protein 5-like [Sinocyclocheilus grahami]|uniref:elongation of very long chain fatty acids protein 5-like n=1 Tax=Sinocyclocheilus grahami TaxID=75366 RepID=UPI0007ACCCB0|nr:PREDICTED: elongation of very long chain fatty acids protein 5-like [Sinocyclocheilus grahami]